MRQIKFRAWSPALEKMFLPVKGCNLLIRIDGEVFTDIDIVENVGISLTTGMTLMQFTGLKDKNEKEIYEGDVVKLLDDGIWQPACYEGGKCEDKITFATVGFEAGEYILEHRNEEGTSDDTTGLADFNELSTIEIIGNIYENPKLLIH